MRRPLAALAVAAAVLPLLAGCSAGTAPKSDSKPAQAKPASSPSEDPVGYLYKVDQHRHARADVNTLVHKLRTRCTDDPLALEFTATNTAASLVDARHPHQDVYPVLAQLGAGIPRGTGKFRCAPALPAVAKQIKAARVAAAAPTPTRHATPAAKRAAPQPAPAVTTHHTSAPVVDDHGGATAQCNDGTLSYSQHHQGTCSHHHGVAVWYR